MAKAVKRTKKIVVRDMNARQRKALRAKLPSRKRCSRCEKRKRQDQFRLTGARLTSMCKGCYVEYNREWREAQ